MSKTEIDRMVKRYMKGKLSEVEKVQLALAIKGNPKTREIAISGAIQSGDLKTAFKLL